MVVTQNCSSSASFFGQHTRVAFEIAIDSQETLWGYIRSSFELHFEHNYNLPPALLWGQSVWAVGSHSSVHTCEEDISTAWVCSIA